jgi:16S rRNA (adenine1518-N6/adenine1519-N6)-dimethyltransferase
MRQPFGQNFLTDENIACKIVDSADIRPGETVIEIGPGKGILTSLIAQKADKVIAVELDRNLASSLGGRMSSRKNVEVISKDFLQYEFPSGTAPVKFISNLPYGAATPIIEKFLPWPDWIEAIVMVQKEVGERIAAHPGGRDYGVLSILTQYFAKPELLFTVGPENFYPHPKVNSIVLRLSSLHPGPPLPGLFAVVKSAFQQRRKTVLNSISSALNLPKSDLEKLLISVKIDPKLRPENLSLNQFIDLTKQLKNYIIA